MNQIEKFIEYVNNNFLGEIQTHISFKDLTTLKIGGQIACLYSPKTLDDLLIGFRYLIENKIAYFIIGNGSNVLAADKDFEMVVISLKKLSKVTKITNNKFIVQAGMNDSKLAMSLAKQGYTKIEFLSVIPGTLGGAIYMNASAYGVQMKDIVKEVTYLTEQGTIQTYKEEELDFSYRHSKFQDLKGIIVGALIEVEEAHIKKLPLEKIATLRRRKKETQPLHLLSAGSTFKNGTNYEAWKVIDDLGYRGYQLAGAMVSNAHTNYLVNTGHATYLDMTQLISKIKLDALNKYNIELECEWEILD